MKVWQSYILLRKPNATHMVPVVRMPPLKARPIPICARRSDQSIFWHGPHFKNMKLSMDFEDSASKSFKIDVLLGLDILATLVVGAGGDHHGAFSVVAKRVGNILCIKQVYLKLDHGSITVRSTMSKDHEKRSQMFVIIYSGPHTVMSDVC